MQNWFQLLGVVLLGAGALAGSSRQFISGTELVEVYVSVTTQKGEPVEGLTAVQFHVRDGDRPQQISVFSAGAVPLGVAAIIDRSFSMRGARFAAAKAGALRFVDELAPEDRLEVASVGSDVTRIAMPGESRERAEAAIRTLEIWGTTPLGDAVAQAIRVVQPWSGRRAVVLFTDGEDRSNDTERGAALAAAQTSGVLVYAVAVGGGKATLLGDLAGSSGGLVISATNPSTAAAAGATLARDLRHQYLVGFTPTDRAPGWHRLTVGVDVPGATVRARKGYFTPGPSASRP